jgi:hypothetical protein
MLKSVFKKKFPLLNLIMGNHDYYNNDPFDKEFLQNDEEPKICQKRFEKILGQKPFSHRIINGYHFINFGNDNKNMSIDSNTNLNWLKTRIKIAMRYNKTHPIFVITHLPPNETVYGSHDWGNKNLKEIFKQYPNIINFSGHSHFPIIDERSIWVKDFIAIQTGSTSYVELEKNMTNGGIPIDENGGWGISGKNTMGLIMDVYTNKEIRIQRVNLDKEKEQKIADDWVIDLRMKFLNESEYYEGKREKKSVEPEYKEFKSIKYKNYNEFRRKKVRQIIFPRAEHVNFVHSYKMVFTNKKNESREYFYVSDFYLMPKERKYYLNVNVPKDIEDGEYEIKIYAIESFGKISKNYLKQNIVIN